MKKRNLEVICGLIFFIILLACKVNAAPVVDVSPNTGTIGISVIVTGGGFAPTEGIVIDFGNTTTIATALTDAFGSFSTTFTITPQPSSGTVTVNAKGLISQTIATTEFNLLEPPQPLLNFYKEVSLSGSVTSGALLTYTLYYQNIGAGTATIVVLTDAIPAETAYITDSATGVDTVTYSHDGGRNYDLFQSEPVTHIKWELTGVLEPRAEGNVSFKVMVE